VENNGEEKVKCEKQKGRLDQRNAVPTKRGLAFGLMQIPAILIGDEADVMIVIVVQS
jgi:hypothetical protein